MVLLQKCKCFNYKLLSKTIKFNYTRCRCNIYLSRYKRRETTVHNSDSLESQNEEDDVSPNLLIQHIRTKNPQIFNVLPSRYYSLRSGKIQNLYLIDKDVAKQIVALISKYLLKNTDLTVECNPGFGYLTNELLNIGIPKLHLFEENYTLYGSLKILQNEHPDRIVVKRTNFFTSHKHSYTIKRSQRIKAVNIIDEIPERKWDEENNMQIIAIITKMEYLKLMIFSVIFKSWLMAKGRPVFFVVVIPSLFDALILGNTDLSLYNTRAIMFQLLFDYEILGTVDRQAFLPWQKRTKYVPKAKYNKQKDHEILYVVRIEPKANVFTNIGNLPLCWYFIRHHLTCRKTKIIPALEKLVPGCGPKLIAKDINIYTEFGELTPEQILDVFKEFCSWPESDQSVFVSLAKNYALKMEDNPDINDKDTDCII